MYSSRLIAVLGLTVVLSAGCDKDKASNDPDSGSSLLGPMASSSSSSDSLDEGPGGELESDEELTIEPRPKLPPPEEPKEQCKMVKEGKKKVKQCGLVDPKPGLSAQHGVYTLLGDFRWGMTPQQVFKVLSKDIETEYAKRQENETDATAQDANRKWRADQLQALKADYTKFTTASNHRWGVSLIQYEYENDNNEEMLWVRTGTGLRKFYFFKDNELWKVFYAYSTDVWPGKSYEDIVEEKFKKWFGASPQQKSKVDPETKQPVLSYYEWSSTEGDVVRSFDMTQVHGVFGLAVLHGPTEQRLGQRLPNTKREEKVQGVVEDVLGGSDVCYNNDGTIRACTEKEAQGFQ